MPEFSRFKLEVGQLFWDGGSTASAHCPPLLTVYRSPCTCSSDIDNKISVVESRFSVCIRRHFLIEFTKKLQRTARGSLTRRLCSQPYTSSTAISAAPRGDAATCLAQLDTKLTKCPCSDSCAAFIMHSLIDSWICSIFAAKR